jgi:hypothetical protein
MHVRKRKEVCTWVRSTECSPLLVTVLLASERRDKTINQVRMSTATLPL